MIWLTLATGRFRAKIERLSARVPKTVVEEAEELGGGATCGGRS